MSENEYVTEPAELPEEEKNTEETASAAEEPAEAVTDTSAEEVLSADIPAQEPSETQTVSEDGPADEMEETEAEEPSLKTFEESVQEEKLAETQAADTETPCTEESSEQENAETFESEERELGEEMVEQLSLLDGELPHLEAANAPSAHRAKAVLEGLLFVVGDEGITAEQAAIALDITPELAAEYFDDLMKEYTDDSRGIEIASYGGVYRFLSKAFVHEYAKRLFQISKQATLSQAALETLAIIAYKQPITRVEIEEIRGVGADMMLRKLLARDLIRESGRSEAAGRPILYEVTEEFMNSFKLLSLKELPELPQFNTEEESEELFNQ